MTHQLEQHRYNKALENLMLYYHDIKPYRKDFLGTPENLITLCVLLAPMAPHIASELWEALGEAGERLHIPKPEVCCIA